MIEGTDYELVIVDDDDSAWACRILTGSFNETVIKFGAIAINEDDNLNFNFYIVETPDEYLTVDNVELQETAAELLMAIFDTCVEEGSVKFTDRKTGKELQTDEVIDNGIER